MRRGRHGPNRLSNYVAVHDNVMQQFLRGGFVVSEDLAFTAVEGALELEGRVQCTAGIHIDVRKRIAVLEGAGAGALVRTVAYSYNAAVQGLGNILRYDSPHPDHNREHHVHRYDVLNGDRAGTVDFIYDEDDVPTLGEVLTEVESWFYQNSEALLRRHT